VSSFAKHIKVIDFLPQAIILIMIFLSLSLKILPFFGVVSSTLVGYPAQILPLNGLFNNQAASANGSADFNGLGSSFDSQHLPPGPWVFDGITVAFLLFFPYPFSNCLIVRSPIDLGNR
jgi:hypothetical protein